jgi:hypothetical protein
MVLPGFSAVDRRRLREAIIFLYKLDDTPEKPSENSMGDCIKRSCSPQGRLLTLVREKQLVETLTFLASTSDDPRKVASLCIEEDRNQRGLTIKLAANHGDLSLVKQGFEVMARILERISQRGECLLVAFTSPEIPC